MKLAQKGAAAEVDSFKQLLVTMKWTTAADFDIAAAYETKEGKNGLVYFGEKGNLNEFPHMSLSEDAGTGDAGGENEEKLRISSLDAFKFIWILAWDYGKVQEGTPARFAGSDVSLVVMDDKGTTHDITLDTGDMGNVAVLATLDNSSPMGAKLVNSSKAGTLKGLNDLNQLINIISS